MTDANVAHSTASTPKSGSRRVRLIRVGIGLVLLIAAGFAAWKVFGPKPDPMRYWREGQAALREQKIDEAGRIADRLSRVVPADTDYLKFLNGQVAVAREDADEAIENLGTIPAGSRLAAPARLLLGQFELRRNRFRTAEALLREAMELDPMQVQAVRELIFILGMQTRRIELDRAFRKLAKVAPLTRDEVFLWCLTRGSVWDSEELVRVMEKVVEADPEDDWSRFALADALANQGMTQRADAELEKIGTRILEAVAVRVKLALDRGDVDEATRLLDLAPKRRLEDAGVTPEDSRENAAGIWRMRGKLAILRRDGPAAVDAFEEADRWEPNHRDTIFGLSQALRIAGKTEEAKRYAERAQILDALSGQLQYASSPEGKVDPVLPKRLAVLCRDAGRIPEARAWLNLAISRDPLDDEAQHLLLELPKAADGA
jgi:tetratricopeptide (TPR) repeat protein